MIDLATDFFTDDFLFVHGERMERIFFGSGHCVGAFDFTKGLISACIIPGGVPASIVGCWGLVRTPFPCSFEWPVSDWFGHAVLVTIASACDGLMVKRLDGALR